MTNHIDELQGKVKQEYGKLRGDADLQSQGAAEASAAHAEHTVEGVISEAAGAVEEYLGAEAGLPLIVADGEARRQFGELQQKG